MLDAADEHSIFALCDTAEIGAIRIEGNSHPERRQCFVKGSLILDLKSRHPDLPFGLNELLQPGIPVLSSKIFLKILQPNALSRKENVHAHSAPAVWKTYRLKIFAFEVLIITRLVHYRVWLLLARPGGEWLVFCPRLIELKGPGSLEINRIDQEKNGLRVYPVNDLVDLPLCLVLNPRIDRSRGPTVIEIKCCHFCAVELFIPG